MCLCLNHAAYKSHTRIFRAMWCYITFGLSGPSHFFIYFANSTLFGKQKRILHEIRVLIFPTNLPETFLIPVTIQHGIIIQALYFACLTLFSNLKQTGIFFTVLVVFNTKFHENPSNGSRVLPCGQTDRREESYRKASNSFSQITNQPKSVKNSIHIWNI